MNILILGCGAIGSRIAIELQGHDLILVDNDRVEAHNIPTSAYSSYHIGQTKVMALSEMCHFRGIQTRVFHRTFDMTFPNVDVDLVIDCFDNTTARQDASRVYKDHTLYHVGVSEDRVGCVGLDGYYPMPVSRDDTNNPICTHLMGQPILSMTALVAVEFIRNPGTIVFVDSLGVVRSRR